MSSNRTTVTLVGNVVADPQELQARQGETFAGFRLAVTPRQWSAQDGWRDGDTSYYGVVAFGSLGRHAVASLRRGQSVLVHGELRVREWSAAEGRPRGRDVEIRAEALGPNLRFAPVPPPPARPAEQPGEAAGSQPAYVLVEPAG